MTDVVVPACNEAGSVGAVVGACLDGGASVVIVVANGCTDDTANAAALAGALVIELKTPDKGAAMRAGVELVDTAEVLFCDGDLEGLRAEHVGAMLTLPPHDGQLVGLVDNPAVGLTKLLPPIAGQRRLPTAFARGLPLDGAGYEAELRVDAAVGRARLPHRTIVLRGVHNPTRATRSPARFAKMVAGVAGASLYLLPELVAYERGAV